MSFVREKRYTVAKDKDIENYLSTWERHELSRLTMKIEAGRINDGKLPLSCVVVEEDWPEYEPVWNTIEYRCSNSYS